jgi:hypothetical protein
VVIRADDHTAIVGQISCFQGTPPFPARIPQN